MNGTFAVRVTFIDNKVCLISVSTPISSVFVELRAVNSSFLLADICNYKKSKKSLFSLALLVLLLYFVPLSVFSLAKSLKLLLEISATYRF